MQLEEWVIWRKNKGLTWGQIREELIKQHSWSFIEAHKLVVRVKQKFEAEQQEKSQTNINTTEETREPIKNYPRVTIRLSDKEIEFMKEQSPSKVLHKALLEFMKSKEKLSDIQENFPKE